MIHLYFLSLRAIAQIFNRSAELGMPTGRLSNEANAELETHPLTPETKIKIFLK